MKKKLSTPPALPASAGFSAAEMAARNAARARAESGTPQTILDAFLGQSVKIGAVEIPVIMLGHVLLLEKIGSPFAKPTGLEPTNEQVTEALFALNHPPSVVLAAFRAGPETWQDRIFDFSGTIPVTDLPLIGAALGAALAHAESTVIGGAETKHKHSPASSGEEAGAGRDAKKNVVTPVPATAGAPRPNPTG